MKTKTPKPKLPYPPNLSTATVAEVINWAKSLPEELPLHRKKLIRLRNAILAEEWLMEKYAKAKWHSRAWLPDACNFVLRLPHVDRLEIRDFKKQYIPSEDVPKLRKAAAFLGLRLEHIEFEYWTMPAKKSA